MSIDKPLRLAIISDLHCRHSNSYTDINTNLLSDKSYRPIKQHPVSSFLKYIDDEHIKVDYLICPGDITDRIDPQGLITGWAYLEELKKFLEAKDLLACLGNHDVDSRAKFSSYNPFDLPKRMNNNFPFPDKEAKNSYYSQKYAFIERENTLFFIFNSVHSHINSGNSQNSLIEDDTLESIEYDLNKMNGKQFDFKVAFTHHHPIKHSNMGFVYKDIDVIEKGDKLIDLLGKNHFQIFIHGHKHEPRLVRYNTTPILASGSFSSLENLYETGSKNYFHIISLYPGEIKGKITNYEYTPMLGWDRCKTQKIGQYLGFGATISIRDFCTKVDTHMTENSIINYRFEDFIHDFEEYYYYLPDEQNQIHKELEDQYQIVKAGPAFGFPYEFKKM